jgi:hypothetical protein
MLDQGELAGLGSNWTNLVGGHLNRYRPLQQLDLDQKAALVLVPQTNTLATLQRPADNLDATTALQPGPGLNIQTRTNGGTQIFDLGMINFSDHAKNTRRGHYQATPGCCVDSAKNITGKENSFRWSSNERPTGHGRAMERQKNVIALELEHQCDAPLNARPHLDHGPCGRGKGAEGGRGGESKLFVVTHLPASNAAAEMDPSSHNCLTL